MLVTLRLKGLISPLKASFSLPACSDLIDENPHHRLHSSWRRQP